MNKTGEKDYLSKTFHAKCFRKIFDRFHQGMSRRHVFRIPLQNFELQISEFQISNLYAIYNFWLYVSIFTLICENTLFLSCMDEEKNVYRKTGNGKVFAGRKRYVDIFVKYVQC